MRGDERIRTAVCWLRAVFVYVALRKGRAGSAVAVGDSQFPDHAALPESDAPWYRDTHWYRRSERRLRRRDACRD